MSPNHHSRTRPISAASIHLATLQKVLTPRAQWKPYPTAKDRAAWEALPESVRQAHIRLGRKSPDARMAAPGGSQLSAVRAQRQPRPI